MNTGVVLVILLLLFIGFGVGGYFLYTKWWIPKQCNDTKENSNLNILNFIYDSDTGNCIANTCTSNAATSTPSNKTDKGDSLTCPAKPAGRSYGTMVGNCTTGAGNATDKSSVSSTDSCKTECDTAGSGCQGYEWNTDTSTGVATHCKIYSGKPTASDTTKTTFTCYPLN